MKRLKQILNYKMQRVIAIISCVSIMMPCFSFSAYAIDGEYSGYENSLNDFVASGECGENLTWTLDDEGCLTIIGSGETYGYKDWDGYEAQIKSVILPDGLLDIPPYAFSGCVNLEEISVPDSVITIGTLAFYNCSSLTSIKLSENLKWINIPLFVNSGLKSLTFPASLERIPMDTSYGAFRDLMYVKMEGNAPETGGLGAKIDDIKPLWILVPEGAVGYDAYPWTEYNIYYGDSIHIKNLIVQEVEDVKYSGEAVNADIVIMDGNYQLEEGVDYTVEYANNVEIGTAEATITGQGWYSGTQIINFNIVETLPENSDVDGSASGVTTLTGEIAYTTAYTLTIPASIDNMDLSQDAETTLGVVSVTKQNADADFDPAKRVDVAIEYSGELLNTEDSSKKVIYKLQQSKEEEFVDIITGDKLIFFASDIEFGSAFYNLKAIITETNKYGGTYSGNINFSAMVENEIR